jgi:tape measure domain-containing protein
MADLKINIIGNDKSKQAFNSLEKNVTKSKSSLLNLKNVLLAVAGSVIIRQYGNLSNEFQQLQNRLKLVTKSSQELKVVQSELFDIAQRTRGGFSETVELYQKLALQSRNLGLESKELATITENVNKVIAIAGVGSVQASSGILQLSQAFASGRLQGDEFRSISENIPPLLDIFAKELGVTRGELKELGSQGKITSEIIATSLLKETENINKQYGKLSSTIGQSTTVLKNSFITLVGVFNEATGAADFLATGITGLSRILDKLSESLKPLPDTVEAYTNKIKELREELEKFPDDPESFFTFTEKADKINKLSERLKDLKRLEGRGGGFDFATIEDLKSINTLKEEVKEIVKFTSTSNHHMFEMGNSVKKTEETFKSMNENALKNLQQKFTNISTSIKEGLNAGISGFSNALARAIILGEDLGKAFKSMVQDALIKTVALLIEAIIRFTILKFLGIDLEKGEDRKLQKAKAYNRELKISVALATILAFLTGGASMGGGFLSTSGGSMKRASGGSVQKGKPYMVGEQGAELFIPNSTGQITQSARGTGGGGDTNINFNISALDSRGVKELLIDNRATIVNAVNSALNEKGKEALV